MLGNIRSFICWSATKTFDESFRVAFDNFLCWYYNAYIIIFYLVFFRQVVSSFSYSKLIRYNEFGFKDAVKVLFVGLRKI